MPNVYRFGPRWGWAIRQIPLWIRRSCSYHCYDVEEHRLVLYLLRCFDTAGDYIASDSDTMVCPLFHFDFYLTIDDASRDIRYLYQSLVSNIFYCLPWAIALPRIGITPDTAWTYHKWVLWVDHRSFASILLLLTECIINSGGSLVVSLGIIAFVDGLWALRLCGWRVSRKERTWVFRRTNGGLVSWLLLIFLCCIYTVSSLWILMSGNLKKAYQWLLEIFDGYGPIYDHITLYMPP